MECFKHPVKPAAGLYKFCMRGVCADGAIEAPHYLACSKEHAAWAEGMTQVQQASMGNVGLLRAQRYIQPIASVALIALGIVDGYLDSSAPTSWVLIVFGVLIGLGHLFGSSRKKAG